MVLLVGILNITPDSFSDGGIYDGADRALARAEQLFADGACIVDVGAESTRPGAIPLSASKEWGRLQPILPYLIHKHPGEISLDTYHADTAAQALLIGSDVIINDISGLQDDAMYQLIVDKKPRVIVGSLPAPDAQAAHHGKLVDNIQEVIDDLTVKYDRLVADGVPAENITLDPCIGFGKTRRLNWQLLEIAKYLPGKRVMIGYSRKRFLGENRLELSSNLHAADIAARSGATYLRVHDVAGHAEHFRLS
ncbi:MAG TPA: dihydropteroate synthase [Candidatus Saccharimonadaceae bacterium]|nr:dihydropteroate synthase [Candidatus Saccharimonadaceae bacterium]